MGKKGKSKNQSNKQKIVQELSPSLVNQNQAKTQYDQVQQPKKAHSKHEISHDHHTHKKHNHSHKEGKGEVENKGKQFTWQQIGRHDHKDDLWVVIDNKVYDLSKLVSKHPGGTKVIAVRAGRKADKAFAHGNHPAKVLQKSLPHYQIGTVIQQSMIESWQRQEKTGKMDSFVAASLSFLVFAFIAYMIV